MLDYHPTLIILTLVIGLMLSYNRIVIFSIIALAIPIVTWDAFYELAELDSFSLFSMKFIFELNDYNEIIGTAFTFVMFAANTYALSQDKKKEVILGNIYAAFAFFTLLAGDFISMFVGLELMMIISTIIIFIGGKRDSLRSAKKYFLTHLISGSMIIIGITHIISRTGSTELIPLAALIDNPEYSRDMLLIMLTGMLVNIAAVPFSGWMVRHYANASPSGFLYLISFTTTVSMMLLIKTFAGYQPLEYFAVAMIIYASLKGILENNILRMLCYLSIMSLGYVLLGVSTGITGMIEASMSYMFLGILYKLLLSMSAVKIIDVLKIKNCSELRGVDSPTINTSLIITACMMFPLPITSTFLVKTYIDSAFFDSYIYYVTTYYTFMLIFILPWKEYFESYIKHIEVRPFARLSFIFLIFMVIVFWFIPTKVSTALFPSEAFKLGYLLDLAMPKQLIVLIAGLTATTVYKLKRIDTRPFNLIEWLGYVFFYFYNIWMEKQPDENADKEAFATELAIKTSIKKISSVCDQRTAIYTVFISILVMLAFMM